MLKVVPLSKAEEQERVCLICGVTYDKSQFAYAVYENKNVIGASQFYVKDGTGYISDLRVAEGQETGVAMLLGRAVLNFLDLHGIKEVYFEKSGDFYDTAAKAIGFKDINGSYFVCLEGMFTSGNH